MTVIIIILNFKSFLVLPHRGNRQQKQTCRQQGLPTQSVLLMGTVAYWVRLGTFKNDWISGLFRIPITLKWKFQNTLFQNFYFKTNNIHPKYNFTLFRYVIFNPKSIENIKDRFVRQFTSPSDSYMWVCYVIKIVVEIETIMQRQV